MKSVFGWLLIVGVSLLPGQILLAQEAGSPDPDARKKIYKQVQPDGTVTYTDEPGPRSEEIQVQPAPTYTPPKTPSFTPYQPPARSTEPASGYSSFSISTPAHDESVRANTGDITVSVAISPGLDAGHHIEYLLDGKLVQATAATSIQLNNVDRGTHTITARLVDQRGATLEESSVTIHLQRTSTLQPGRNPPPVPKPKAVP